MAKSFFKYIMIFIFLFHTHQAFPDIKTIKSIQEVNYIFENAHKNDIFVFDLNETLITPKDNFFRYCDGNNPHEKFMYKLLRQSNPNATKAEQKRYDHLLTALEQGLKYIPVEEQLVTYINTAYKKNASVIILTKGECGETTEEETIQRWKKNLRNIGFNFTEIFQQKEKFRLNITPKKTCKNPLFYSGVIMANCYDKGEVLLSFVQKEKLKPRHIFYFDDQYKHIQSISETMEKASLPYTAFHTIAYQKIPCHYNKNVAEIQENYFYKNAKWLDEDRAKSR